MVAIVLAAGYATRLYPITLNAPKALLDIGDRTMLDYIIDKINRLEDLSRIVIISNAKFYKHFTDWKDKRFAKYVNGGLNRMTDLIILNDGTASEQTRLGAIGDIIFAIDTLSIDDDVVIIAGDNFFTFQLTDMYAYFKQVGVDCIAVKRISDRNALKNFGVAVMDADCRVIDFEEKPQNPKSDCAVFATYFYKRETLPLFSVYIDEGNPKDAPGNFPAWLCKKKHISAYVFDGDCYDVGTSEAYEHICKLYGKE